MDTDSADSAEASDAAGEEAATSEQIDNTEEKSEAPATTEYSSTEENTAGATETTTEAGGNTTEATTSEQTDKNYVMVNGYVYTSNGETVDAVPQGFELAGQVKTEDSDGVPTEDMQSHNVAAGTNIYTSSVNSYYIYVQSSEGKYEMYVVD
jgi:hypothetical protein